jgi:hypothetical protein
MTWPSAILSALYGFIASNRQTGGAAGLNAFTAWLNGPGNGLIRAYVPATPGQGHQSATANILRRLFMPPPNGLGYAGRVNVYLDRAGSQETFVQLDRRFRALLPELVNMVPPYRFWGGTLNTIDLKQPPKDTVKFGLSGGSDDNTFDYAKKMNVDYFLRLQPYRWGITIFGSFAFMPQEIRFLDKTRGTGGTLNLTSQKALGGATLAERAYKQRMATIDWATFPQADPPVAST